MSDRAEMLAEQIARKIHGWLNVERELFVKEVTPILRAALDVPPAPASPVDVDALSCRIKDDLFL